MPLAECAALMPGLHGRCAPPACFSAAQTQLCRLGRGDRALLRIHICMWWWSNSGLNRNCDQSCSIWPSALFVSFYSNTWIIWVFGGGFSFSCNISLQRRKMRIVDELSDWISWIDFCIATKYLWLIWGEPTKWTFKNQLIPGGWTWLILADVHTITQPIIHIVRRHKHTLTHIHTCRDGAAHCTNSPSHGLKQRFHLLAPHSSQRPHCDQLDSSS